MTENKQITIEQLLPLLRKGWVAMNKDGVWTWFDEKPQQYDDCWHGSRTIGHYEWTLSCLCNFAPFDGDWKDSLIEVK